MDVDTSEAENSRHGENSHMDVRVLSNLDISHVELEPSLSPEGPFQLTDSPTAPLHTAELSSLAGSPVSEALPGVGAIETISIVSSDVGSDGDTCMSGVASASRDDVSDSTPSNEKSKIDNCKPKYTRNLPESLKTPLFIEHVILVKKTWAAMHCHDCRINVNKAANSLKRRMAYCANCELYFCEECLKRETICYCNCSPIFIT